jgi:hypothetical protein
MKKIITTPAGRQKYLEVLLKNLIKNKQDFDEWHLWLNTTNQEDIIYCQSLADTYSWIKAIPLSIPHNGNLSIHSFFRDCADHDAVYIRLDDDIVFLEKNFCKKLFQYRVDNPDPFLVYGNIVNNACISHLHQRYGALGVNTPHIEYSCMGNMWRAEAAQHVYNMHQEFIGKVKQYNSVDFMRFSPAWILNLYERVSINCISWLGKTFAEFGGNVGYDEEAWLSMDKPASMGKPNVIFGDAVCAHFSFYTQRDFLDKTDVLQQYSTISNYDC